MSRTFYGHHTKLNKKKQKRRELVAAGRQQLYCAVQPRSPSHCPTTTGKVQSSARYMGVKYVNEFLKMPKFDHWFSRRCPTKLSELFATTTTWSWQWGRQRSPMTPPLRRLPRSSWPGPARPAATSPPAYMSVDCHPPAYDATPSSATKINDFVRYRFSRQHFGQASLIGRTWRRLVRDFQLICDKLRPVPWRKKERREECKLGWRKEGNEVGSTTEWFLIDISTANETYHL